MARGPKVYDGRYTPRNDADFLEDARQRFKQAENAETQQRERELEDLQFFDGKQWPQQVINSRTGQPGNANNGTPPVPARPTITIDKIREPIRQVLNQERQADLGISIVAVDDFGGASDAVSDAEIQLREGLVRRIQRESQAADARSWAFQRAAIAGRGFYRVMTRFVPGKTFDQDIYVDRIYNQASVLLDPSHEQPDGSDAEWGFIGTDVPYDRYLQEYGQIGDKPNPLTNASQQDWRALGDELPNWFTTDGQTKRPKAVRVVEYWYREPVPRTLLQLHDGSAVYEDEGQVLDTGHFQQGDGEQAVTIPLGVDDNGDPLKRTVYDTKIRWAKIDGVQVLEQTDWPGRYIPIIKVLGEEIQPYDDQRRAIGMVRPVRDSQRMYNAMVSKWTEKISSSPNNEWMVAAGADEGFEDEYDISATRVISRVHFNPYDDQGRPIPPPQRNAVIADVSPITQAVMLFDQNMSALLAAPPEPRLNNTDPRVKTARGLQQLLQTAQQGTSHLLDNLTRSIRYEGLIVNDLLAHIYNRPGRIARMMTVSGETKAVSLGSPIPGATPQAGQMPPVYQLTPGSGFNMTVTVGRNYDTRRQEQESLIVGLVQTDPQMMGVFGDLLFKYSDSPGHEELQKRAEVMLAPPVQAMLKGQPAVPPQVMAQMAQLQQQVQQLSQLADKNKTDLMKVQMQEQGDSQRSQADNQVQIQKAEIAAAASMSNAQAKVDAENFRSYVDALETRIGKSLDLHMAKLTQAVQTTHEHVQNVLQQQHERVLSAQEHQQSLQQAQQGAQIASQQAEQQAALAPAPEAGA